MSKEKKDNGEFVFSISGNKVIKNLNGKYCLNIELSEDNYKILMDKYLMQTNPINIKHIDLKQNKLLSKLKPKEITILKEISKSKTNPQIADLMNLSTHTIKKYVSDIYKKLNVTSRIEAIQKARSENLIDF